jgi:hypothetical protein
LHLRSFRAAIGPLFKVLDLTFWSFSKILLFFHHGEHGGHGEVFGAHVAVSCGSWLKFSFFDRIEAERRKTDFGSPEGERSELIDGINKMAGSLWRRMTACCCALVFQRYNTRPPWTLCPLWSFCSGFSPVLFPFRCFLCPLVHSLFHPWITAVWRPCLALGYCFYESGFKRGRGFLTELTKLIDLTKWQEHRCAGCRYAAALWLFGFATRLFLKLNMLLVILFRFFTSFVSFSVIRLSFSSFCFPSVDCGRMASLPGLGLIVFVGNWVHRGIGGFFRQN